MKVPVSRTTSHALHTSRTAHSSHSPHALHASQVPDIYDCTKYDLSHNFEVLERPQPLLDLHEHVRCPAQLVVKYVTLLECIQHMRHLRHVLAKVRCLAQLVVPLEYGSTLHEMLEIGSGTLHHLLHKLMIDLEVNTYICNGM